MGSQLAEDCCLRRVGERDEVEAGQCWRSPERTDETRCGQVCRGRFFRTCETWSFRKGRATYQCSSSLRYGSTQGDEPGDLRRRFCRLSQDVARPWSVSSTQPMNSNRPYKDTPPRLASAGVVLGRSRLGGNRNAAVLHQVRGAPLSSGAALHDS